GDPMTRWLRLALVVSLALNVVGVALVITQMLSPSRTASVFGGIFFTSDAMLAKLPAQTRTRLNQELADDRAAMKNTLAIARAARTRALDLVVRKPYSADAVQAALGDYRASLAMVMEESHKAFVETMNELSPAERQQVVSAIKDHIANFSPSRCKKADS